jgi:hypothetical protein
MLASLKHQIKTWTEENSVLIKRLGWAFVIFYLVKAILYITVIVWASSYF